jgi:hypothetical protein
MNQKYSLSFANALSLGFGAVDPSAIITGWQVLPYVVSYVLVANSPQLILSVLYFSYNRLFTAMLMSHEWTSYAHKRKGLRVSHKPVGSQRSTHFLQLPYRFGIPFVVLSGILHWLVSQSIFLVAIDITMDLPNSVSDWEEDPPGKAADVYDLGHLDDYGTRTCGYSPLAMLVVIILGAVMMITVYGLGFLSYQTGIPLAGSSSMAMSSACHPKRTEEYGDTPIFEQKLQFGVVEMGDDGIGHCAFSSEEVRPLIKGVLYI